MINGYNKCPVIFHRAGRVKPGVCYHIFSSARYQHMNDFATPELLRCPLQVGNYNSTSIVLIMKFIYFKLIFLNTGLTCILYLL